jgi:uncharacterized membrane protein YccC
MASSHFTFATPREAKWSSGQIQSNQDARGNKDRRTNGQAPAPQSSNHHLRSRLFRFLSQLFISCLRQEERW